MLGSNELREQGAGKKIKELQDKNAKLEEAIKGAELARKDILDHKFKEVQGLQEQIMEMSEGYRQSRHEVCELKKENEAQKREIINLKAKLYDLITAKV